MITTMSIDEMNMISGITKTLDTSKLPSSVRDNNAFVDVNVITTVRLFFNGEQPKIIKSFTTIRNDDKLSPRKVKSQVVIEDDGTVEL